MNTKQLHAFLVIAQEHQITSAAKILYTSQPPLSYQMKQLEKELGTKLFVREAHGIELTAAGRAFQKYAQQVEALSSDLQDTIQQEQSGKMGIVKLGLISSAGAVTLKQPLLNFRNDYPGITFQITEDNTFGLIKKLNNDLINVAIVRTPYNARGLMRKKLNEDRMVAVYNPQYFKLPSHRLTSRELNHQPLILYRRFEAFFNERFAQAGLSPFYAVKCDDARTAILWADRGMGIALVPESIAHLYAQQTVTTINEPSWQSTIEVVWKKGQSLKPLIKRFIDAI